MERFHRSMNQERNSSTVTGQDRKKHGPRETEREERERQKEREKQRERERK
jgi:hypothetical protein